MKKQPLTILGAGLFAEEIASNATDTDLYEVYRFVEGIRQDQCGRDLLGHPVIWIEDLKQCPPGAAVCAVGSPKRKALIEQAVAFGTTFISLIHPSVQQSAGCTIGAGSIVCPGTLIATGTTVQEHVIINRGCLIGHHATIESYATLGPGVNIAGRTRIGNGSTLGMGAIILDGITIGKNSIVGSGALVTRDVPDNVVVMGIPAKVTKHLPTENN